MPPRKLDEIATDIDDAKTTIEELQSGDVTEDKFDDLRDALEHASDTIDDLEDQNNDHGARNEPDQA